jgi:biotin carboxyl carrier protein
MKYTVIVDGDAFEIEIGPRGRAWVNQEPYEIDLRHVGGNGDYSLLMDNRSYDIHAADSDNGHRWVTVGGRLYRTELYQGHNVGGNGRACGEDPSEGGQKPPACRMEIRAPLPGLLIELRVREGERVEERQVVAVLESMKMNLEVRAPRAGVVRDLDIAPGRQVAQDQVLAVLDE